ncbi:unnamed protein product [Ascophyllum nodosum]
MREHACKVGPRHHDDAAPADREMDSSTVGGLDASDHDGNWQYYKERAHLQTNVIGQLTSMLETYGYHLPKDPAELKRALSEDVSGLSLHVEADAEADAESKTGQEDSTEPLPQKLGILQQGSLFIADRTRTTEQKFEEMAKELPMMSSVDCEMRVKGLSYSVQRAKGSADDPTVGDSFLAVGKTLACLPLIKRCAWGQDMESKTILRDVKVSFKPSTTTLVLGPPGCGKSTLLKALGGLLKRDSGHHLEGSITYNGDTKDSGKFSLPKVAHFAEQADRHLPTLTVEETFRFAFDSMAGGTHKAGLGGGSAMLNDEQKALVEWMDSRYFKACVDMIIQTLGLLNARHTIVGNNELRGVSGGERRRVTFGEMLCGPHVAYLMDSISTGLDASTTFDIMTALKASARSFKKTVVVALLQPPPETYELFDNVCLMAEGMVIYHGKREDIIPYFNSLGLTCPPRKDEADWLVGLTGTAGDAFRANPAELAERGLPPAPVNAEEFHARWRDSAGGEALEKQELSGPEELDGTEWPSVFTEKYPRSWFYHLALCFRKKYSLMRKNKAYVRSQMFSAIIMGIIMGTIFYDLGLEDANAKFGLIFFSLFFLSMSGMAQIPTAIVNRGVFYKQSMAGFYPTSCEVVSDTAVNSFLTILQAAVFAPIVYFMAGFSTSDNGMRFFVFMVLVVATNLNVTQYFRFLAAAMPNFTIAQGFGGLSIMFLLLFCGYLIAADGVPAWWIWIFHVNPIMWAFRASVLNEFQSPEYEEVCAVEVDEGSDCPSNLGQVYIDAYSFADDKIYIWGAVGVILVEFLIIVCATGVAYEYLRWDASDSAPILPNTASAVNEDLEERLAGDDAMFNIPVAELKRQPSELEADLPFEPVTLTFKDMSYSVPHPSGDGNLELLTGISGFCKPGQMTALMGSSGAGKTTLLDVLAGRKTGGTVAGDIRLNGHPKIQETFNRRDTILVAGYVEQQDMHSTVVTVREALMFSADMRLDDSEVLKGRREEFVDSILTMLELDEIRDRLIGSDEEGGLSLEQRKRTTLGVELAANPSLIFLDEPTSGLDARSAQVVMRAIRKVAATQRTVICTIHQPSTYLFEMFDALLLLKKGGQTVFFGPLGDNSEHLISYLQSVPNTVSIRDNVNPATWMLEVIGAGTSGKVNPQVYADFYNRSTRKETAMREMEQLMVPSEGSKPLSFVSVHAASLSLQIEACMARAVIQYWRNPNYNFMRIMISVVVALVFGSSFIDQEVEDEADVASILGVIFMSTMFVGIICFQTAIPAGSKERIVFYREQAANMYNVRAYAIGYAFAELPYILLITLSFCSIFYWIMGLASSAEQFFMYWLYFTLWVMYMVFTGMFFVMALPNVQVAQTLGGVLTSLYSLFAGFMISPAKITDFWLWGYYLDPLHYTIEVMATTQFRNDDRQVLTATGEVETAEDWVNDFFGGEYKYSNRWYDVMGMVIFILAVRFGYLYALRYIRHLNR